MVRTPGDAPRSPTPGRSGLGSACFRAELVVGQRLRPRFNLVEPSWSQTAQEHTRYLSLALNKCHHRHMAPLRTSRQQRERHRAYIRQNFAMAQLGYERAGDGRLRKVIGTGVDPYSLPACDSPLEDSLASLLMKLKAPNVIVGAQHPVGPYFLDFVVAKLGNGRMSDESARSGAFLDDLDPYAEAIGIECDGRRFHSRIRDRPREEEILRRSSVARIYRFPGSAITHVPEVCLYIVACIDGWVFTERGSTNLETAARFDLSRRRVELAWEEGTDHCEPGDLAEVEVDITWTGPHDHALGDRVETVVVRAAC